MNARVIVVGSLNIDLVSRREELPAPGETVTGARFERHHGGKGGNQAVAAARLGAPTAFVGTVGDDAFGDEARAGLSAEGIDLAGLRTVPGATGVALILVDRRGENLISVASGANADLDTGPRPRRSRPPGPSAGDVVLVGHEIPTGTAATALRLAHGRPGRRRSSTRRRPADSTARSSASPTSSRRTGPNWRPSSRTTCAGSAVPDAPPSGRKLPPPRFSIGIRRARACARQ